MTGLPNARVSYTISTRRGPWDWGYLHEEDGRIFLRGDRGLTLPISDLHVRKIGVTSIVLSLVLAEKLPGYNSRIINIAFGDGGEYQKNFGRGFASGYASNQAMLKNANRSGERSEWLAYFRQTYPGGRDLTASPAFIPAVLVGGVLLIALLTLVIVKL
jgi:hypothetical protein